MKLKLGGAAELDGARQHELEAILKDFVNVLDDKPGCTTKAIHKIDMGEAHPTHSLPYRLCPAWRQQVRD